MHELAITETVVDAVTERTEGQRVLAVNLEIGRLSGVLPDAVRFCFDLVTGGTPMEGARLEIAEPAGRARCRLCDAEFEPPDLIMLCPCGSSDVEVLAGHDMRIVSVEVN